jgi:hypothetical protein
VGSVLKKLDVLRFTAGEDGIVWSVSIVLSASDGRGFRERTPPLFSSDPSIGELSSTTASSCSLIPGPTDASPKNVCDGFLKSTSWLTLRESRWTFGVKLPPERSRSRGSAETASWVLTGVDSIRGLTVGDDTNWSREGAVRRRGFWMTDGL